MFSHIQTQSQWVRKRIIYDQTSSQIFIFFLLYLYCTSTFCTVESVMSCPNKKCLYANLFCVLIWCLIANQVVDLWLVPDYSWVCVCAFVLFLCYALVYFVPASCLVNEHHTCIYWFYLLSIHQHSSARLSQPFSFWIWYL